MQKSHSGIFFMPARGAFLAAALLLLAQGTWGENYEWSGEGVDPTLWDAEDNWDGGTSFPGENDTATILVGATLMMDIDTPASVVNEGTITGTIKIGGDFTNTGTVDSSAITVGGDFTNSGTVNNSPALTLNTSGTFTGNSAAFGSLTVGGTYTFADLPIVTTLANNGTISVAAFSYLPTVFAGDGTVILTGTDSLGATPIFTTLEVASNATLTLTAQPTVTALTNGGTISVAAFSYLPTAFAGDGTVILTGTDSLGATLTFDTLVVASGVTLTLTAQPTVTALTNGGTVSVAVFSYLPTVFAGDGTVILTGTDELGATPTFTTLEVASNATLTLTAKPTVTALTNGGTISIAAFSYLPDGFDGGGTVNLTTSDELGDSPEFAELVVTSGVTLTLTAQPTVTALTNNGTISIDEFSYLPSGFDGGGTVILTVSDELGATPAFATLEVASNVTLTLTAKPIITTLTNKGTIAISDPAYLPDGYSGTENIDLTVTDEITVTAHLIIRNLTIEETGILVMDGKNLTLSGTYSNAGTLTLSGTETLTDFTQDTDSGTTKYTGGADLCGLSSFYNLEIDGGSPVLSGNITVSGETKVTSGSLDLGGNTLTTGTFADSGGSITSNGGTITVTGSGFTASGTVLSGTITIVVAGGNINVTGSHAVTSVTLTNSGTGGNTTFKTNNSAPLAVAGLTVKGDVTIETNGTLSITPAISTDGAVSLKASAITVNANITAGAGGISFTGPVTLGADTTLTTTNSAVTFTSTVDGAQALSIAAGTGAVTFTGAVGETTSVSSLTITSGTVEVKENVALTGDLTIASGATLTGTSGKTISVSGDWTNNGTFAGNSCAVTLTGNAAQTVSGDNTFGTFTITNTGTTTFTGENTFGSFACTVAGKTVEFPRGKTQTVNGAFTFGNSSARSTISACDTGTGKWTLNAGTTETNYAITYTDITDGIAGVFLGWTPSTTVSPYNGEGTGDSTANFFANFKWTGGASTAWTGAGNWSAGMAPPDDSGTNITIPGSLTTNYPVLTGAITAGTITVASGATFTTASQNITATKIDNYGTVKLTGKETLTGTDILTNNDGSTVEYYGTEMGATAVGGNSYKNLVISKTGGGLSATDLVTAVTLSNPSGANGNISFTGGLTVNSTDPTAFNTTGTLTLGEASKTSSFAGGLTVTGAASIAGTVESGQTGVAKAITFSGAVTLSANTTLTTNGGVVTFTSTVDGVAVNAQSLTIEAGTGKAVFGAAVGGITALASLSVTSTNDGNDAITIRSVTTSGAQAYTGKIKLGADTTLTTNGGAVSLGAVTGDSKALTISSGDGTVTLAAITGAVGVSVTTSGAVTWGGAVTAASVTQLGTGENTVKADISTTGGISFAGSVTLLASGDTVTIATSASNGNVTFSSTVNGTAANTQSLTIEAGTGKAVFGAAVGGTTALASLSVTSTNDGNDAITIRSVTTSGAQAYTGKIKLGADTTLTTNGGAVSLGAVTGDSKALTISSGDGTVTLAAITDAGAVSVTSSDTVTWGGTVTAASVTQLGTGENTVKADISTTGGISFAGPVTLLASGDTVTIATSASNGNVTFSSTVDGVAANTQSLTIDAATGKVVFGAAVGGNMAFKALTIQKGTVQNKADGPALSIKAEKLELKAGAAINTSESTNKAITLKIDSALNLDATSSINAGEVSGNSIISIAPITSNKTIEFGDAKTLLTNPADVYYSSEMTAAKVIIGDTNTSTIYVSATEQAASLPYDVEFVTGANIEIHGNYKSNGKKLTLSPTGTIIFKSTADIAVDLGSASFEVLNDVKLGSSEHDVSITATGGISFGKVVDTAKVVNITSTPSSNGLTLNAGTNRILFNGKIGASSEKIGALTIKNGESGSGATNIAFNDEVNAAGAVNIIHTGTLTTGADITADGGFVQSGTPASDNSIGGNITTTDKAISLNRPVTITHATGIVLKSANTTGGAISFTSVTGAAKSFTVNAGTGTVTVGGDIGSSDNRLGTVAITAGGITLQSSTANGGTTIYTSAAISLDAPVNATYVDGSDDIREYFAINSSFDETAPAVTITEGIGGSTPPATFTATGAKGILIQSVAITTNGAQTYTGPVTLNVASASDKTTTLATTTNSTITFTSTVDGTTDNAENLTVTPGSTSLDYGSVVFSGAVGSTKKIGKLTVTQGTVSGTSGDMAISASEIELGTTKAVTVQSTSNKNITLTTDTLTQNNASVINAGSGTFQITPSTATNAIGYGAMSSLGTDNSLYDAKYDSGWDSITAGEFKIGGNSQTGNITLHTVADTNVSLTAQTSGKIIVLGGYSAESSDTNSKNENLTLIAGTGGIELAATSATFALNLSGGTLTLKKTDGATTPAITNSNDLHLKTNGTAVAAMTISTGGDISIGSIINDDASYNHSLEINVTDSKTITLAGDVGTASNKLGAFTVTAKVLAFSTANGAPASYAVYTKNAAIDLSAVQVTGTGKSLTLNAGTGNVTLNTVGTDSARLGSLTIVSNGIVSTISSDTPAIYTTTGVTLTRASSGALSIKTSNPLVAGEITLDFLGKISAANGATAGTVTIGDAANTTGITVDAAADLSGTDHNLTLVGNTANTAHVTFNAALTLASGKTLTINTGGNVTSSGSTALVTAGTLSVTKAANIGSYTSDNAMLPTLTYSPLYTKISTLSGNGLKTVAQDSSTGALIIDNTGDLEIAGQIGDTNTQAYLVNIDAHSKITQTAPIYAYLALFSATTGITLGKDNNIAYTSLANGAASGDITFVNSYSKPTSPMPFPAYPFVAAKNTASGGAVTITEKTTDLALGNHFPLTLPSGYEVTSNKGAITLAATGTGKALLLDNSSTANLPIVISTDGGNGLAAVTINSPVYATYPDVTPTDTTRESLRIDGTTVVFGGAVGSTTAYLEKLEVNAERVSNAATGPALSIAANELKLGAGVAVNTSASVNKAITLKIDSVLNLDSTGATINAGTGTISIAPIIASQIIEFGDEKTSPSIDAVYYSSMWSNMTASKFTIGDGNTSKIYVSDTGLVGAFGGNGVPYEVEFVTGDDIEIRGNYKSKDKELTLSPAGNIIFSSDSDITVDLGTASFEVLNDVKLNKSVSIKAAGGISFGKVDTAAPANSKLVNITSDSDSNGLTLNAGSSGILFNGKIGTANEKIGTLMVNNGAASPGSGAANVTFNDAVFTAGAVNIMHTGMLTTAPGTTSPTVTPTAHITADGGFIQGGTPATNAINSIGGDIITNNTVITLNRPVTITHATGIALKSGGATSGNGNIFFASVTGAGKNFTVNAGTGSVIVGGDIGGDGTEDHPARLGAVSITGTGITLNNAGGGRIWTNSKNITLDAGTGTLATTEAGSVYRNLTLDVTKPPADAALVPTITLAADTEIIAGTLTLSGTVQFDVHGNGGNQVKLIADVVLPPTARVTLALPDSASDIIQKTGKRLGLQGNDLSGATLDLAAYGWLVGEEGLPSGFGAVKGSFTAHANSTLIMRGTGKTLTLLDSQRLGNLTISTDTPVADMVTLGASLTLQGNMTLKNGNGSYALSVGADNHNIWMYGNWEQANQSDFKPASEELLGGDDIAENPQNPIATVTFMGPPVPLGKGRTVTIKGKTNWYNLVLTYANGIKTVQFSNFVKTDSVANNGHRVRGKLLIAGGPPVGGEYMERDRLYVTRLDGTDEPPIDEPWEPDNRWWLFEFKEAHDVLHDNCENYDVSYSWATAAVGPIQVIKGQYVEPYYVAETDDALFYWSRYNIRWFLSDVFLYSFTEDVDGNGRIDRIRAQSSGLLHTDSPGTSFAGFEAEVEGYEVDTAKGVNGYEFCEPATMIYIWLKEQDYPDTGVRPRWKVKANETLITSRNKPVQTPTLGLKPIDTAPPRISYTLAVPGDNKVYVRMTERVLLNPDAVEKLKGGSFATRNIEDVMPVNASDHYTDEFCLVLAESVKTEDIMEGTLFPVNALDGLVDYLAQGESKIPSMTGITDTTSPYFPVAYPSNDPDTAPSPMTYVLVLNGRNDNLDPESFRDIDGLNELRTEIPNRFNAGGVYGSDNRSQYVSSILIMVEPNPSQGKADPHLSVWPLRMRDASVAVVDSDNNVIGRAERYDGRGRLRPPQIETEFITNPTLNSLNTDDIVLLFRSIREFDGYQINITTVNTINMPPVMEHIKKTRGMWLPDYEEGGYVSGLAFPFNYRNLQWAFSPLLKTYADADHTPKSAKMFEYSGSERNIPMKEIVYLLSNAKNEQLYGLWLDTWVEGANQYSFPQNWWERDPTPDGRHKYLKPFNLIAFGITQQVSGVTILNNVINPTKNENAALTYSLSRKGRVTINVFTLDGTLVRRLFSSVQEAGDYDAVWNGMNQGGRPVARGMYFIRIVAPDIDEIRKVMVVK